MNDWPLPFPISGLVLNGRRRSKTEFLVSPGLMAITKASQRSREGVTNVALNTRAASSLVCWEVEAKSSRGEASTATAPLRNAATSSFENDMRSMAPNILHHTPFCEPIALYPASRIAHPATHLRAASKNSLNRCRSASASGSAKGVSSVATAFVLLLVPLIAVESCMLVTSPGGPVVFPHPKTPKLISCHGTPDRDFIENMKLGFPTDRLMADPAGRHVAGHGMTVVGAGASVAGGAVAVTFRTASLAGASRLGDEEKR